ncbi:hypothetical protein [Streptomyces corynorhini]|uniref:Uncharacterized protein n=1 Tax=Streptomyces corynorhini TaxID=2282652 RepID=A0A370BBC4_9ACTN|nr:hypothetical protein [Streptomyces corynorhini]RDG37952.1 hypothetical protein DVH02_11555 [Streptomyces corynorhini]
MPGPLPSEDRRRRNAPTIPTTKLPVSGRTEPAPRVPAWVKLGKAGRAWWKWAWATPQACAWAPGHESMLARRAALEDDLAALATVDSLDATELLSALDDDEFRTVRDLVGRLAALATGRLAIFREMRELDDRLGLTPKGMAALRWTIVPDPVQQDAGAGADGVTDLTSRRRKLTDAS